jgi:hypothetical protein
MARVRQQLTFCSPIIFQTRGNSSSTRPKRGSFLPEHGPWEILENYFFTHLNSEKPE